MRSLHVGLRVEDVARSRTDDVVPEVLVELERLGIEAQEPSSPSGSEDFWTTWLTDPDVYRIELVQWPPGHSDGLTRADFPEQTPAAGGRQPSQ